MGKTEPTTYRVSEEVDTELRRLAKIHGGVDKALRVALGIGEKLVTAEQLNAIARQVTPRQPKFSGQLLRPKDRK